MSLIKLFIERVCGVLCGSALFAVMALTLLDVAGRKLLSHSLPGSLELTELLMVVVIFAGLPLVSLKGEHVVFDTLDKLLPATALRLQRSVVHLLCCALLAALAWLMWGHATQFASYGETTAQLRIAKAPFIYGMSALCAITALAHLLLAIRPQPHEKAAA